MITATEFVVRDQDHLSELFDKYPQAEDRDLLARPNALPLYFGMREAGESHNFAAMCACRKAPKAETDREFFEGRHTLAQQFEAPASATRKAKVRAEMELQNVVASAKAAGYNPSVYDVYDPGLAEFVGDPKAFVPPSGGRNYVRRQCEARGISCDGPVKVKGREALNPTPAGQLAPDLIEEAIQHRIAANPELARVDRRDLVADAISTHGYTDAKRAGQFTPNKVPHSDIAVRKFAPKPRAARKTKRK